nr:MAG TPA: hypothetical protein [Caudoviricetes sp.]
MQKRLLRSLTYWKKESLLLANATSVSPLPTARSKDARNE